MKPEISRMRLVNGADLPRRDMSEIIGYLAQVKPASARRAAAERALAVLAIAGFGGLTRRLALHVLRRRRRLQTGRY